jgi:hypothetical protein
MNKGSKFYNKNIQICTTISKKWIKYVLEKINCNNIIKKAVKLSINNKYIKLLMIDIQMNLKNKKNLIKYI